MGWRLLTCPIQNINTAKVALITTNPGGATFEPPMFSCKNGNAYAIEDWGFGTGQAPLQLQVQRLLQVIGEDLDSALTGYFVPFRSPEWKSLRERTSSLKFGQSLWQQILPSGPVRTVIAFGKEIASCLQEVLGAQPKARRPAGWGSQTIDEYAFGSEGRLIVLPHLSRFKLFNRPESESAFRATYFQVSAPNALSDWPVCKLGQPKGERLVAGRHTRVNSGSTMSDLTGPYRILDDAGMRKRASQTDDPRHVFYEAMLSSGTCEAYLSKVRGQVVHPATTSYVVTGPMEFRYCMKKRWITNA